MSFETVPQVSLESDQESTQQWLPENFIEFPDYNPSSAEAYWHQHQKAVRAAEAIAAGAENVVVSIDLPQVVGYIPQSDRLEFDKTPQSAPGIAKALPYDYDIPDSVKAIIDSDVAALGLTGRVESVYEEGPTVDSRKFNQDVNSIDWHVDSSIEMTIYDGDVSVRQPVLYYFIANTPTTLFYAGDAVVTRGGRINYDDPGHYRQLLSPEIQLNENSAVAQPEPYSIVRVEGQLGLHSRPPVTSGTHRVFMRVSLYPT